MKVYQAINKVSAELLRGISKDSQNKQQGFAFRGIDAVYNALAPALVAHGLVIIPRMIERTSSEKITKNGTAMSYVVVHAEFDFVCAEDGSKHTVSVFGEGSDSGDKATNKAMAIAYKYAAFQTFCIPTEDTSQDPDAESHVFIQSKLTQDQVIALQDAITEKGYAIQSACKSFKVAALAELPSNQFNNLMSAVAGWPHRQGKDNG